MLAECSQRGGALERPEPACALESLAAVGLSRSLVGRAELIDAVESCSMYVWAALAAELCALIANDDETRARLAADGALFARGYHPEMAAVHRANVARLADIVAVHGWPGRSQVGDEAASAAWRILQHAIDEPAVMRRLASVVAAAAARGDADPAHVAMLEDRIRVLEGRPQRYGTQYDWDETLTAMVPMIGVEDPDDLDARRAAAGLPPMEWRRPVPTDQIDHAPASWTERQRELDAWARARGWRT